MNEHKSDVHLKIIWLNLFAFSFIITLSGSSTSVVEINVLTADDFLNAEKITKGFCLYFIYVILTVPTVNKHHILRFHSTIIIFIILLKHRK